MSNHWHVRVDSQGNVDTDDLQAQAVKKAKQKASRMMWGCIFSVVFAVVFIGTAAAVIGYVYWNMRKSGAVEAIRTQGKSWGTATAAGTSTSPSAAGAWDGKSTYVCSGNQAVLLADQTVTLAEGTAIQASANCNITLRNMHITAPVAIDASGNAKVTIIGGEIKGTTNAVKASANANVTSSGGAKLDGKVVKSGAAKVEAGS